MQVKVTKGESVITYGYDPSHYAGVVAFYSQALEDGEIQDYSIEM
jgi:hypothetical protein